MKTKLNIILIAMDTVRADHLHSYGYHRKTTRNIDKIAEQGVLFENAFTAAPWTPPSHASIFTGKYPSYHKTIGKNIHLEKENTTLAEVLSQHGYRSIGISSCNLLGPKNGFDKGFKEFIETSEISKVSFDFVKYPKDVIRTAIYGPDQYTYRTNEIIKRYLKSNRRNKKPFYLFVNYFNCHAPYDPPRPFKKRYSNVSFDESRFYVTEFLLNKVFEKTTERISHSNLDVQKLRYISDGTGGFLWMLKRLQISKEEWEVVKSWYDGEIAYLDYRIGELVDFLYNEGILDNTLLIITSDHGENFDDHALFMHPFCLYDSILHVPLIMMYPSLIPRGRRISNLVSTIDIFPTVLDILGIKRPNDIQGRSLYPFENRKIHDFICAEYGGSHSKFSFASAPGLEKIDKGIKCIRTKRYKYMTSSNHEEELYDIHDDPLEENNLIKDYPIEAENLRKQLENTIDVSYFGPTASSISEEMMNRLKALGYIG